MTLFTETTFVGIDPTAGQRPFVYAALNAELQLLAIGLGEINNVLAFVAGQQQALVAAYTGCLAANTPEQTCTLGHPDEGLMYLPVVELKARY